MKRQPLAVRVCVCVCQGNNSNHAQTARFNIPTFLLTAANHVWLGLCVHVCARARVCAPRDATNPERHH